MDNTIDLKKFKKIINKIRYLGFKDFYQAGSPSQFHELNLIIEDKKRNIQYWICKSFGEFKIIYRKSIIDSNLPQYKISNLKSQKEVCEEFEKLIHKLQ